MEGFFPILTNSLAIKIAVGVFPVPPKYIFPIQITGILNFSPFIKFFSLIRLLILLKL